jgi:hypothetical protein
MDRPELSTRLGSILCEFRGAPRILTVGDRTMPEDVPHPVAKSASQASNDLMYGMTVAAGVAAILDQGHFGIWTSQDVIAADVNRRI